MVFLVTVACAAVLLPSSVDIYYAPTDQPDVVYARWQYLLLVVVGAGLLAAGVGAMASVLLSLIAAFTGAPSSSAGAQVSAWVGAWVLLWSAAAIWLTAWLGNANPERRSWLELLLGILGLMGVGLVTWWQAWLAARTVA